VRRFALSGDFVHSGSLLSHGSAPW
jgi:hypothetical protein